jgi:hypothetical protein
MVKILDTEISSGELIVRIIAGSIASAITLILLTVLPSIVSSVTGPVFIIKSVDSIIGQVLNPIVPVLGAIVSLLILTSILLRKSRIEGPLLISLGAATLLYFYVLQSGGITRINITPNLLEISKITEISIKVNASISLNSVTLLILVAITSVLIVVKGIILIRRARRLYPIGISKNKM